MTLRGKAPCRCREIGTALVPRSCSETPSPSHATRDSHIRPLGFEPEAQTFGHRRASRPGTIPFLLRRNASRDRNGERSDRPGLDLRTRGRACPAHPRRNSAYAEADFARLTLGPAYGENRVSDQARTLASTTGCSTGRTPASRRRAHQGRRDRACAVAQTRAPGFGARRACLDEMRLSDVALWWLPCRAGRGPDG
jgi:hypothetical protein